MRSRNIKPGIFTNEILGQEDPFLTILFAGLWCLADREGRLEDRPLRIKAEVFPYRESIDIHRYLTELSRLNFILRYEAEGSKLILIHNFLKHQSPHRTERRSVLPAPNIESRLGCESIVDPLLDNSEAMVNIPLIPDSLIPDSLIPKYPPLPSQEGTKKAKKVPLEISERVKPFFDPVWNSWPSETPEGEKAHRGSRAEAERAFQNILNTEPDISPVELKFCGMLYAKADTLPEAERKQIFEIWDYRDKAVMHIATFYGPKKRPYRQFLPLARTIIAERKNHV